MTTGVAVSITADIFAGVEVTSNADPGSFCEEAIRSLRPLATVGKLSINTSGV